MNFLYSHKHSLWWVCLPDFDVIMMQIFNHQVQNLWLQRPSHPGLFSFHHYILIKIYAYFFVSIFRCLWFSLHIQWNSLSYTTTITMSLSCLHLQWFSIFLIDSEHILFSKVKVLLILAFLSFMHSSVIYVWCGQAIPLNSWHHFPCEPLFVPYFSALFPSASIPSPLKF